MTSAHTGPWTLKELYQGTVGAPKNGKKVFSTFSCGGGSTMGYKLAGFEMIGCCEIDEQMMEVYQQNHLPKRSYEMGIQEFNKIPLEELPRELLELDILDGSPPCSVFSTAGQREKGWGVEKVFREGQALQRLDDLFLHFINCARRLRPKVVVAENVMGMMKGSARGYVKEILAEFVKAGYDVQLFALNAQTMGVPQRRGRIFFVGRRMDLNLPKVSLEFDEKPITFREATADLEECVDQSLWLKPGTKMFGHWRKTVPGHSLADAAGGINFTNYRLSNRRPSPTLLSGSSYLHPSDCRRISPQEIIRISSFPDDYRFAPSSAQYVCGMSVPPLMMQRIALSLLPIL